MKRSLRKVDREKKLEVEEALPIFQQVARGLAVAHKGGIVHRDLKPANIMLVPCEDGIRAVITDFGLASSTLNNLDLQTSRTVSQHIIGTPEYMSPEQLRGGEVTPASDVYSLGVVMYVTVTGKSPFRTEERLCLKETGNRRLVPDPHS